MPPSNSGSSNGSSGSGRWYGRDMWHPGRICGQIWLMQLLFYAMMGLALFVGSFLVGAPMEVLMLFQWRWEVFSSTGWVIIMAYVFTALTTAGMISVVVERVKKCIDFAFTVYFIHVCLSWGLTGEFPSSAAWWLVLSVSFIITAWLGEYLCYVREMREISVDDTLARRARAGAARRQQQQQQQPSSTTAVSRGSTHTLRARDARAAVSDLGEGATAASLEGGSEQPLPAGGPRGIFRSRTAAPPHPYSQVPTSDPDEVHIGSNAAGADGAGARPAKDNAGDAAAAAAAAERNKAGEQATGVRFSTPLRQRGGGGSGQEAPSAAPAPVPAASSFLGPSVAIDIQAVPQRSTAPATNGLPASSSFESAGPRLESLPLFVGAPGPGTAAASAAAAVGSLLSGSVSVGAGDKRYEAFFGSPGTPFGLARASSDGGDSSSSVSPSGSALSGRGGSSYGAFDPHGSGSPSHSGGIGGDLASFASNAMHRFAASATGARYTTATLIKRSSMAGGGGIITRRVYPAGLGGGGPGGGGGGSGGSAAGGSSSNSGGASGGGASGGALGIGAVLSSGGAAASSGAVQAGGGGAGGGAASGTTLAGGSVGPTPQSDGASLSGGKHAAALAAVDSTPKGKSKAAATSGGGGVAGALLGLPYLFGRTAVDGLSAVAAGAWGTGGTGR